MTQTGDTPTIYEEKLQEWVAHWKPANPVEQQLVEKITQHDCLIHRVFSKQNDSLADSKGAPVPDLIHMLRYQATQERAFLESTSALQELRDFEQMKANGFVSQKGMKAKKHDPNEGNPWMNMDLDPATETGWADPITGKFTPFGDGFASELAEEQAREEADRLEKGRLERDPVV